MRRLLSIVLTALLAAAILPGHVLAAGIPTTVTFVQVPAATPHGVAFTQQPIVHVADDLGADLPNASVQLAIKSGTGTSSAALNCTANPVTTDSAGLAAFAGCSIDLAGSGYVLTATATISADSASGDSTAFDIGSGNPVTATFGVQPGGAEGGTAFTTQPVVHVVDEAGLPAVGAPMSLAITALTGTAGAALGCTADPVSTDASGDAAFAGCAIDKAGTAYQLTATGAATPVDSAAFDVLVGPAAQLAVTVQPPATATAGVALSPAPQVAIEDAGGNVVTTDNSTSVAIALTSAGGAMLSGTTSQTAASGLVAFPGLSIDKAGGYTLTATSGSLTAATTSSVSVDPAPAASLTVTSATSATAGVAQDVTVTAKDAFGNTATGYAGTVRFSSTDAAAVLPSDYPFAPGDAGTHTFAAGATLKTAGTQSITATDTVTASVTGTQSGITVSAGAAVALVLSGFPTTTTAGAQHQLTVTVVDGSGNPVTRYTGTVTLTSSDGAAALPTPYTFVAGDGGTHAFDVTLKTAGSQAITAGDGSLTSTQSAITVNAGPAASLTVTSPTSTTAGVAQDVTVTAKDAFGNAATGYTGKVHISSTDVAAALPADYTFGPGDAGTHTFAAGATLKTAGTQSITATDTVTSSLTATQSGIAVSPAAASSLVVAAGASQVAGLAFDVTVTARDAYGNTATGYTGTIRFGSTDPSPTLPADYTFQPSDAGAHTFTGGATLTTVGSQTITATDIATSTVTGTSPGISVAATGSTPQTVTFAISGKTYPVAPFTVAASSTSGLTTFTYTVPTTTAVCSVSGSTVTVLAAGTCTVRATQAGNTTYQPATADASFVIAKGSQTVTFTSTPPTRGVIGRTYTPTATATTGLSVVVSVRTGSTTYCTISGGVVTFRAAGTCILDATQAGNGNWSAATASQSIRVDATPTCPSTSVSVVMNVAKAGAAPCSDADLDPLAYAVVTRPAHGTISMIPTGASAGTWSYTSNAAYVGSDAFTVTASDGFTTSAPVTITLNVTNAPVVANVDVVSVRPVVASAISVLANDSPGAGDAGQPIFIKAVTQPSHGSVWMSGSTVVYDPAGCYVSGTSSDLFTYTVTDGLTTSTTAVVVKVVLPGQKVTAPTVATLPLNPVTNPPAVSFVIGSAVSTTAVAPMRLSWCSVLASGAVLRSYRFSQSSNGGSAWSTAITVASAATSRSVSVAPGYHYAWKVLVIDSRGLAGAYAQSAVSTSVRTEDSSTGRISYSGTWRVAYSSNYSGGSERYATSTSSRATFTTSTATRQFAIVASRTSTRGSFRVYLDGAYIATVSDHASTTLYRRVLYVRNVTAGKAHKIMIVPVSSARVDLDAILTLQ